MQNFCQSFIFNDIHVRGNIVKITEIYKKITNLQQASQGTAYVLGEAICAAAMLIQSIKVDAVLTLQFQSDSQEASDINLLAVKIAKDGTLRATIDSNTESNNSDNIVEIEKPVLGEGHLVVTIQQNNNEPRQSIIAIEQGQTISQALEQYFLRSEQMPTIFHFACNDDMAAGIMLQKMPEFVSEDDWNTLSVLFKSLTSRELLDLDAKTILYRLFNQYDINLFDENQLNFKCSCSLQKMQSAVMSLGKEDALEALGAKKYIEVTCDFCKQSYNFDKQDILRIFRVN